MVDRGCGAEHRTIGTEPMVHIDDGVAAAKTTRIVPPKNPRSPYFQGGGGGRTVVHRPIIEDWVG